jgi:hypothetical protein
MTDPVTWTDNEWLEAMRVTPFPKASARDEAVAIVASWNAVREVAEHQKAVTALILNAGAYPHERLVNLIEAIGAHQDRKYDLVLVAVPNGAGVVARQAITRGMGI